VLLQSPRAVRRRLARSSPGLVTVDVFDTLLLRDEVSEIERFEEASVLAARRLEAMGSQMSSKDLLAARLTVHKLAYRLVGLESRLQEPNIGDIFGAMLRRLGCEGDAATVAELLSAELQVEAGHLSLNRVVHRVVKRARHRGWRVIALSDMYLTAPSISHLLAGAAVGEPLVHEIVSSADSGVTKRSGDAFGPILEMVGEGVTDNWIHIGDNWDGEVAQAQSLGADVWYIRSQNQIKEQALRRSKACSADLAVWASAPNQLTSR
jgi:predicted HAD superfamily hydrolase